MACNRGSLAGWPGVSLAIALDLGTSGLRAQALDPVTSQTLATAMTLRHPLPGANVIDHLHLVLELGMDATRSLLLDGVGQVLRALRVPLDRVGRLAVCGNPVQLSLLQGLEVRDLAYPGRRKQESLGISPPPREAVVTTAARLLLPDLPPGCEVVIPPAVFHHVGADAMALIMESGIWESPTPSIAIDYGTNAEMAISCQGRVHTASTAAGPALEGQHLTCGMLAAPGAVAHVTREEGNYRLFVLDSELAGVEGPLVDLREAGIVGDGAAPGPSGITGTGVIAAPRPLGITGTGVIALLSLALEDGLVARGRILTPDRRLHLGEELFLTEDDLVEAGKAVGAVRAGYITLCHAAGVPLAEVSTAWMAGASGTQMDPTRARHLGLLPPSVTRVHPLGNTSLSVARALALSSRCLGPMATRALQLRETHCQLATSRAFARTYVLELSHWTEGMPMPLYRSFLARYGLPELPPVSGAPIVIHASQTSRMDPGLLGLLVVDSPGRVVEHSFEGCTACRLCVQACPQRALSQAASPPDLRLDAPLCRGFGCRQCERACPRGIFDLGRLLAATPAPVHADPAAHGRAEKEEP